MLSYTWALDKEPRDPFPENSHPGKSIRNLLSEQINLVDCDIQDGRYLTYLILNSRGYSIGLKTFAVETEEGKQHIGSHKPVNLNVTTVIQEGRLYVESMPPLRTQSQINKVRRWVRYLIFKRFSGVYSTHVVDEVCTHMVDPLVTDAFFRLR